MVEVGKVYQFHKDQHLGDYSESIVLVEVGPRGSGNRQQYRVSWGKKSWEVDWIDANMFNHATILPHYDKNLLIYG